MSPSTAKDIHLGRRLFVTRLLSKLGAPTSDIDDLAQDALLKFYTRYADIELETPRERVLLARIGYSTYVDALRRRRVMPIGNLEPAEGSSETKRRELGQRIDDLCARAALTPQDIKLLEMRFGEGKTCTRIAADLGFHPNTVRRRISQALSDLRRAAAADSRLERIQRIPQS